VVTLTDKALDKVRQLADREQDANVLRLAVEGGGCSGFQYAIGFDTGSAPDDVVVDAAGVTVVIDPVSLPYLRGSQLDYVDGLINAGFTFTNPNVAATCGCNASFQAKPEVHGPYSPKAGNSGCAI
jgi:iron-sulfur cluster assembly accessory protein